MARLFILASLLAVQISWGSAAPNLSRLPLAFEPNRGQFAKSVLFATSISSEQRITISKDRVSFRNGGSAVDMLWRGGRPVTEVVGESQLPGISNFILGANSIGWHVGIPQFQRVRIHEIYKGVDLILYGNSGEIEYDLILSGKADIRVIDLHFDGVGPFLPRSKGALWARAENLDLFEHAPHIFQESGGRRIDVSGGYDLLGPADIGFHVGKHQQGRALIVDPVLSFSTRFGGSGTDRARAVAVDSSGCIYIVGDTSSTDFPLVQPFEASPTPSNAVSNARHIFVTKLNPTASTVLFSTYLGGSVGESGRGVAVDPSGNVYVLGTTVSPDYPVTANAIGSSGDPNEPSQNNDVVLTKLAQTGSSLVYSAVISASGDDEASAIALDGNGDAFIAGTTNSPDFPVTTGAHNDLGRLNNFTSTSKVFVSKINPAGTGFLYSAAIGGTGADVASALAIDGAGNAYIGGTTTSVDFPVSANAFQSVSKITGLNTKGFAAELSTDGSTIVFGTYIGGSASEQVQGLALDYSGNIYLTGLTTSPDFPTTAGAYLRPSNGSTNSVFLTKITNNASAILYSSLFGGFNNTVAGVAVDQSSQPTIAGSVDRGLDVAGDAVQILAGDAAAIVGSPATNAFIVKLNSSGTAPIYSTYLGGTNAAATAVATDSNGDTVVAGISDATFPITPGAFQTVQPGQVFVANVSAATGCSFAVQSTTATSASVTTPPGCTWIAVSGAPWIRVASGQSGSGNGSVQLIADPNAGVARAGSVSIAGTQFTVTQASACTFSLSSPGVSLSAAGGSGQFTGFGTAGCTIPIAASSATWIHITSNAGASLYAYTVDINNSSQARSASVAVGNQAFVVTQAGLQPYVPIKFTASMNGATVTTAGTGCTPGTYTLPVTLSWAPGTSCTVQLSAPSGYTLALWTDGPTTSQRTIVTNLIGATYSAILAGCTYSVASPGKVGKASGDYLSIAVNTQNGCGWTTSGTSSWAYVQGSGYGSGTAVVSFGNNAGVSRKATVTVAGTTVLVEQTGIHSPTVFRPAAGNWYVGSTVQQWGLPGDVPVEGDYDGDGIDDFAVWRPSNAVWYLLLSSNPGNPVIFQWGRSTDIAVPGDYDGDGKTDLAVWRPSEGTWYVVPSSNPGVPISKQWGLPGDIPVPGDYDGDGKTDFAVWRPSNATWYVTPSSNPSTIRTVTWGNAEDIPTPSDYDGDGKTDFAVWRPGNGTWYIIPSSTPISPRTVQWGLAGDVPVPSDYDGDGKTDLAVWRPANGFWFIIPSANPSSPRAIQWGLTGDIPVAQ